jgi:hypothetical protein
LLILLPLLKFWCIWICNIFTTFNVKHIHSEEIVKKSNLWKKPSLFMSSTELFLCVWEDVFSFFCLQLFSKMVSFNFFYRFLRLHKMNVYHVICISHSSWTLVYKEKVPLMTWKAMAFFTDWISWRFLQNEYV